MKNHRPSEIPTSPMTPSEQRIQELTNVVGQQLQQLYERTLELFIYYMVKCLSVDH